MQVIKSKNVNIENVSFGEPKVNAKYKNISVPITYKVNGNSAPFVMQMPKLKAFVGFSTFMGDDAQKVSLPVSIHELASDPSHKSLLEFFKNFDEMIVNKVLENPSWIKKKKNTSKQVIEAFYTPCLRYPKDRDTGEITDKYPPNLKFKIPTTPEGEVRTRVFGKDKALVENSREAVVKGAIVSSLVECTGIWVVNGKFGVSFRALQLKIDSVPQIDAYGFIDDSDDEEDNMSEADSDFSSEDEE